MDNSVLLNKLLAEYKIAASCVSFTDYKNMSCYDLTLSAGGKIRNLEKHANEIALALKAPRPKVKFIYDQGLVRLSFYKEQVEKLSFFNYASKISIPAGELPCLIGETMEGDPLWMDLVLNPHAIIAGTTGSGKSTMLHCIIANLLLYKETKIHLMDPKNIEFYKYQDIGLRPASTFQECCQMLEMLVAEMDQRYQIIKDCRISSAHFPYQVLIIDEFADLILQDQENKFYDLLAKLAQKSRAARIHIILATQRPSVDIVNGFIKANFPTRIACKVASNIDARVILDSSGAEHLRGKGDAIIKNNQFDNQKFQGLFTSVEENISYVSRKA